MNCLAVRRRLLTDPSQLDPETREHLSGCAACEGEAERLLRLDEALRRVLLNEPSFGLESPPLSHPSRRHKARTRSGLLATAAIVLLSLSLAVWTGWQPGTSEPGSRQVLAVAVLDHVQAEIPYLERDDQVSIEALAFMLGSFGARLLGEVGEIRFLGRCRIRQSEGVHMILAGETGRVTVLLMPEEEAFRVDTLGDSRFRGLLLPAGQGSMAVVGERGARLGPVVEKLGRTLVWEG